MIRKSVLVISLASLSLLTFSNRVFAQTPISRAVIQLVRNRVQLIPKQQPPRTARVSDAMRAEDALSTGQASLAELRFNDGSLARVGESAVFRFIPNTRNFRLSNGMMLLLVPPGQGTTRIRTPNAAAGIRGSALFVRYIPDRDTTIIGALTNSDIQVANRGESQRQGLQAGQMAVVVRDRIEAVYNFNLNTFYETNELVQGLDLTSKNPTIKVDSAIAQVRAETTEAVLAQIHAQPQTSLELISLPPALAHLTAQHLPNYETLLNQFDLRLGSVGKESLNSSSAN